MKRIHTVSFFHAFQGLMYALGTQPNFVVHVTLSSLAVIAGLFFGLSNVEWMIIVITITFGLLAELINTAIESTVDLITHEWRIEAKHAKDTAAAAMLIYAVGAVVIASFVFLPKIFR